MKKLVFQSADDWRNILDSITDIVTIHDIDFNILHANSAAKKILNLPDIYKKLTKCYKYYHGAESPPEGCPSCSCIKTGKAAVFEVFEPHLEMYLEIRSMPRFDENGKIIGLIHIARDITESKVLEAELHNAKKKLEKIVEERTKKLKKTNEELKAENKERKMIEENLRFTEKELIGNLKELKESNIALKVLLNQRENDQRECENNILSNLNHLVLPYLAKLKKNNADESELTDLTIIESNLNEIVSPFSAKLYTDHFNLTPREIQMADLIKDGKQDKEITDILNISLETVKTHRKNIRKKLGIYSKRINLRSHLLSLAKNR
jgi:DNA-binding CsgD family transcriptional regulator